MSILDEYLHALHLHLGKHDDNFNEIKQLIKRETLKIMSELTDLQAKMDKAVADAKQAFTDAATKLDELAGSIGDTADLPALKADIASQADALEAAAAAMEAKVNPTPPTV